MKNLILLASSLAIIAISTGKLPWILENVRIAQIQLIEESKASKWGKVMILSVQK